MKAYQLITSHPISNTNTESTLIAYMQEIAKYKPLPSRKVTNLAIRVQAFNDIEAVHQLVCANLRLVVKIAMEYHTAYGNIMDLIQEGNIGLMKAVSKFDPTKGVKLSYYAGLWIRSYIVKYILDNFRLVKIGTTQAQKKLFYQLIKERERLEAQGLDIAPRLLADKLSVREKDVMEMSQRLLGANEVNLQSPLNLDSKRMVTQQDLLVDQKLLPDDRLAENELQELFMRGLDTFTKTLKEKELVIFQERLISENPKTLQEIADQFGLTRERIRQLEIDVIEKLKNHYYQILNVL